MIIDKQDIKIIKVPKTKERLSDNKKLIKVFLKDYLKLSKNSKVLEIGCGDWNFIKKEIEGQKCQWFGLDVIHTRIANVLGTIDKIPFPDKTFDGVICNQVLEHIYEYGISFKKAFKEINRVLKPNGQLIATVPIYNHGHPFFLLNRLNGFKGIIGQYFNLIRFERFNSNKFIKGWQRLSDKGFWGHIGYPNWLFPKNAFTHQLLITAIKGSYCDIRIKYKYRFRLIKMLLRFLKELIFSWR